MTAQLRLQFQHMGGAETGELPVVVDVLDAELEQAVAPRPVRVQAGWSQDLEPGIYLARVTFPSGEHIAKTCTLAEGETATVPIDVHGLSGHESLERSAVLRPLHRNEAAQGLAGPKFASVWLRRWEREAGSTWHPIRFDGVAVSRDDHTVRYQFLSEGGPQRQPRGLALMQQALELGGPSLPWRFITLPPSPVVDVTVTPRGDADLNVEVTTQNADAEALLGYMRTGAIAGAEAIAERLLQQKLSDPISAAIGGYYLLRVAQVDRLSGWGPNLSHWFPWFPDGAVINGWQYIHSGRKGGRGAESHFDKARQELLTATTRGIPVYTQGLRLLSDGLRLIAEQNEARDAGLAAALDLVTPIAASAEAARMHGSRDFVKGLRLLRDGLRLLATASEDQELQAALDIVAPFAACADWTASTVTYRGEDPANPDSVRRLGLPPDRRYLVMLQQVGLTDLVELGLLNTDSRLVARTDAGKVSATVTESGGLDIEDAGSFTTPEDTGREVLGLDYPDQTWYRWEVARLGRKAPRAHEYRRELGRRLSLADLRQAARG